MAILITEVIVFSVLAIIFSAIINEIAGFASNWGLIQKNIFHHVNNFQMMINEKIGISLDQQSNYLNQAMEKVLEKSTDFIAGTIESLGNAIFNIILIPVYVFLILLYHNHLTHFVRNLFDEKHNYSVNSALDSVKTVTQNYLNGLLIEMLIIAFLNIIGLSIVGVDYAVLLGLIAALLNLVPYVGALMATILGIVVTLSISEDAGKIIGLVGVFVVVRLIDDYILIPKIIGSKVKINALASIVAIITGGAIAGVFGMFLSIPTIAILKVVFDHSLGTKAWGDLLSDETHKPLKIKLKPIFKRK